MAARIVPADLGPILGRGPAARVAAGTSVDHLGPHMLALTLNLARRHAWAIVVMTGLGACSAEPVHIGPAQTEVRTLIDEHCGSVALCGCAGELVEQDCADELSDRWESRRIEAEALGLTYDSECFEALAAQIEEYDCYWPGGTRRLCDEYCSVYHGDKEVGEDCDGLDSQASDCAQGLVCHLGTCAAPCDSLGGRTLGERCRQGEFAEPFDDCAPGLFCSWETGTCLASAGQGESCAFSACGPGLTCTWPNETCELAAAVGEDCEERQCAHGLYCDWSGPNQSFCRAYAQQGEQCFETPCDDGLWCDDSNVCVGPPEEGQLCLFGSICEEGLVCSNFDGSGTCLAPPEAGSPCLQGTCATGTWCDTSADPMGPGTCTVAQPVGEMCAGHSQCESNYCPNGFCWEAPLLGEPCDEALICAAGLVCNGEICELTNIRAPAVCSYTGW